jgi:hypothetical protein
MDVLGGYKVDTAEENIVQQRDLFSEQSEDGNGAVPTVDNSPLPKTSTPRTVPSSSTLGDTPPANRPISSPGSTASPSRPSASAKSTTIVVSVQEREAVFKALDHAARPLIMWQITKECPKISQQRMEQIIPLVVSEGFIKRVETQHAVMYCRLDKHAAS